MDGRIIVIDGPDGTGKATVTKNVLALLNARKPLGKAEVLTQSFPRYESFYGRMVRAYLDGDDASELVRVPDDYRLDPICASVPYALDRYRTFVEVMRPAMEQGHWFLCDRYYTSNMGHQGSRMDTLEERLDFFDRLMWLEAGYCQLPEPATVVILDLPEEVRQGRTEKRRQVATTAGTLGGQVGRTDIHEQDPIHMRRAADVYRQMAAHFNWPLVNGVQEGRELSESEMAELVYRQVMGRLPDLATRA